MKFHTLARIPLGVALGAAVSLGLAGLGGVVPPIQPVTITYQEIGHSGPSGAPPDLSRTILLGVRSDGSTSRATLEPGTGLYRSWYVVRIADATARRVVIVSELTKSTTTYPSAHYAEQFLISPAAGCAGTPSSLTVLGYRTVFQETVTRVGQISLTQDFWRAPSLDCLPLREVSVTTGCCGGQRTEQDVVATSVALGEPAHWLFAIPTGYVEMSPSEVLASAAELKGTSAQPLVRQDEIYRSARQATQQP